MQNRYMRIIISVEIAGNTADATVTAGAVFGDGKTVDNLQGAINGELHEVEQMYPVYLNAAKFQGESGARDPSIML